MVLCRMSYRGAKYLDLMILLFGNEFGINLEIESWVQIGTYFGIFSDQKKGKVSSPKNEKIKWSKEFQLNYKMIFKSE